MPKGYVWIVVVGAMVSGCTSTNVTPIAANAVIISTSAAPVCGRQGAQRVASSQAAVETIRRGYDKFIIVGAQGGSDIRQVGTTPVQASTSTTGTFGRNTFSAHSSTSVYGGQPIYGGSHNQDLAVRMFKSGEPEGANAIDARLELGPDWQKKVAGSQSVCF